MAKPRRPHDSSVEQVLDRLGIAPQQLLNHHGSIASGAASPPRWVNPALYRSGGPGAVRLRSWRIDPDLLHLNLGTVFAPLDAANVGYVYLLNRKGVRVHQRGNNAAIVGLPGFSLGGARFAGVPEKLWDFDVPINLCSVSKLITAVATVMLLKDMQVDPASPIAGYLPTYWPRHWSTDKITFQDLLRHESGLGWIWNTNGVRNTGSGPGDFLGASAQYGFGSGGRGLGTFDYKNCNYTILRVMFPIIAEVVPADLPLPGGHAAFWDLASATFYRNYCNQRLFGPAGIGPFDLQPTPAAARAYGTPPAWPGAQAGDLTTEAGSTGWHLCLGDLMKFIAKFRYSGAMMTTNEVTRFLAAGYGVAETFDTSAGAVYAKRGRWNDNGQNTMDTAIYLMPNNLELGVYINSGPGSGVNQASYNDGIQQQIINSAVAS